MLKNVFEFAYSLFAPTGSACCSFWGRGLGTMYFVKMEWLVWGFGLFGFVEYEGASFLYREGAHVVLRDFWGWCLEANAH
jgi:hypothetical protein